MIKVRFYYYYFLTPVWDCGGEKEVNIMSTVGSVSDQGRYLKVKTKHAQSSRKKKVLAN